MANERKSFIIRIARDGSPYENSNLVTKPITTGSTMWAIILMHLNVHVGVVDIPGWYFYYDRNKDRFVSNYEDLAFDEDGLLEQFDNTTWSIIPKGKD